MEGAGQTPGLICTGLSRLSLIHRLADLANSNSSRNTAKQINLIINVPSWSYLHRAQFFVKKHRKHELLEMGFAWRANRSHHPCEYFAPYQIPPAAIWSKNQNLRGFRPILANSPMCCLSLPNSQRLQNVGHETCGACWRTSPCVPPPKI